jgi:glycosyltransferase involved in cell wall biosynthesis
VSAARVSFAVDSDAWGGAEVYVVHLLRHARQHGWHASLVCSEPVAGAFRAYLPDSDVRTVRLARHCVSAPQFRAALRAQSPDAVLVNLVDPASNAAALEAALSVAPAVATLHLEGDVGSGPASSPLRSLYRRTAAVIAPARDVRRQLVEELGVPGHRVTVVRNGVQVPTAATGASRRRPPMIGGVGRLTEQKGFDVLLRSVASLTEEGVPVQAAVAGDGRERRRLTLQGRGLPVRFYGFVSDVPGFLARVDVFCLPSRRESLPLALLEAMASGLPCIATDVGDIRAAVGSGVVLVPPEDPRSLTDAIRTVLEQPGFAADLGLRAREIAVRDLDASFMAAHTFGILRKALAEPR